MTKRYTASEAAAELGIEAKKLRQLLRADPTFKAPGSGASWSFSTGDMPALRRIVKAHTDKPRGTKTNKTGAARDDDQGLPMRVANSRDPQARAAVRRLSIERVDRLERALLAAGLHISQMNTDRDTRREIVAADA